MVQEKEQEKEKNLILGLDIGGTKSAVIVGTQQGEILARNSFPTQVDQGHAASFGRLVSEAEAILAEWGDRVAAASVSVGGPLDLNRGYLINPPHLPGWHNFALQEALEERLKLPVYVEHDGNAGALAEWLFGSGQGKQSLVFLTAGTGFGAGLILGGKLWRGASSSAGEIGHVRASESGPLIFGKPGAFESFCGGTGISRLAREMYPSLAERLGPDYTMRELADAAQRGDAEALAVIETSGRWLGRSFALLADLLNPEMIVVGSLGLRLGEMWLGPARAEMAREALPEAVQICEITVPGLGEKLQDVAALCAAIVALQTK
jgi:glucokinase